MRWAQFLLCTGFIFYFFLVLDDHTQTSTQPNSQWDFESHNLWCFIHQKLLKH